MVVKQINLYYLTWWNLNSFIFKCILISNKTTIKHGICMWKAIWPQMMVTSTIHKLCSRVYFCVNGIWCNLVHEIFITSTKTTTWQRVFQCIWKSRQTMGKVGLNLTPNTKHGNQKKRTWSVENKSANIILFW
jgi:hypothetical protein